MGAVVVAALVVVVHAMTGTIQFLTAQLRLAGGMSLHAAGAKLELQHRAPKQALAAGTPTGTCVFKTQCMTTERIHVYRGT